MVQPVYRGRAEGIITGCPVPPQRFCASLALNPTLEWLGIPAGLLAWAFAVYIYFIAPPVLSTRLLIAMLTVDGVAVISSGNAWPYADAVVGLGIEFWWRVHVASDWAVMGVYLAFIGVTVNSPLAKPLGRPGARIAVLAGGLVMAAIMISFDLETFQSGVAAPLLYLAIAAVLTWGFAAAVHAWLTAADAGSAARAKAFVIAFGVRDTIWMFTFLLTALRVSEYSDQLSEFWIVYTPILYVSTVIIYVPLVAYGMLRTQLFDIDLRIKRTLKRSTVLAAFVAVFFLISGLAELFLSSMLGNLLGLLCTSALVFFLDPLQRAAERLSDAAMPGTRETPEYEAFRKLQVYESTMNASIEDGVIPSHKRVVLESLIESLGIDPATAQRLEKDALEA